MSEAVDRWFSFAAEDLRLAKLAVPGSLSEALPGEQEAKDALAAARRVFEAARGIGGPV